MVEKENIMRSITTIEKKSELVSVIIPCYNQGVFLDECVDSVLKQTYTNLEIIIVDDGSLDETSDIVDAQLEKSNKISIYHTDNNGVSAARNYGIEQSSSKYIVPLDADDKIRPTFISETLRPVVLGVSDIGFTDTEFFGEKTGIKNMGRYRYKDFAIRNQIANTALFKKKHWEEVGGYNETFLDGYEDWEFWINIGEKCKAYGHHIPKPLLLYRIKKDSRNKNAKRKEKEIWKKITELHPQFVRHKRLK